MTIACTAMNSEPSVVSQVGRNVVVSACTAGKITCRRSGPKNNTDAGVVAVQRSSQWSLGGATCTGAAAAPVVTPDLVRQQVVRMVPDAAVGLAPRQATLVNIQTVMWVHAPTTQELPPVSLLGQQVTVRLRIDHVDWNFGDGQSATSDGPGKAYDEQGDPCRAVQCPDYFGHTYRDTGSVTVRATAYWQASFTVDGGDEVRIPGTVAGPTGHADLAVKQARGVLVPNPH